MFGFAAIPSAIQLIGFLYLKVNHTSFMTFFPCPLAPSNYPSRCLLLHRFLRRDVVMGSNEQIWKTDFKPKLQDTPRYLYKSGQKEMCEVVLSKVNVDHTMPLGI